MGYFVEKSEKRFKKLYKERQTTLHSKEVDDCQKLQETLSLRAICDESATAPLPDAAALRLRRRLLMNMKTATATMNKTRATTPKEMKFKKRLTRN
uniref:Uncharacterized protein n=1 Tax=Romanomermis culicivorax TaxID=13658 RepID=A0A915K462_ROMCU